MPKKSRIPSYRYHKARGLAVVRINGTDHYLGPWKSKASYAEYDRLITEWLSSGRTSNTHETALTVTELIHKYWQFATGYYRNNGEPSGAIPGIKVSLRYLRTMYGTTAAAEFGPVRSKNSTEA